MASAEDELREELEASEPDETKERRGRRIVEPDQGSGVDEEKDLVADVAEGEQDLSAEEAAVHIEEAP
jgi:uncharacterized protein DUF5709